MYERDAFLESLVGESLGHKLAPLCMILTISCREDRRFVSEERIIKHRFVECCLSLSVYNIKSILVRNGDVIRRDANEFAIFLSGTWKGI
jgi:hypothetical protein